MVHPLTSLSTPRKGSLGGSFGGGTPGGGLFGGGFSGREVTGREVSGRGSLGGNSVGGVGGELALSRGLSSAYIRYYRLDQETNRRVPVLLSEDDALLEEVLGLGPGLGLGLGQGSELLLGTGSGQGLRSGSRSGLGPGPGPGSEGGFGSGPGRLATGHGQGRGHTTLRLLAVFEPNHRDWRYVPISNHNLLPPPLPTTLFPLPTNHNPLFPLSPPLPTTHFSLPPLVSARSTALITTVGSPPSTTSGPPPPPSSTSPHPHQKLLTFTLRR